MRYDLTLPIKDLDGVQVSDAATVAGYTLRTALVRTALFVDKTKPPSALEKLEAYALAKRIAQANHFIELSAAEVLFLREQSGAMWSPLIMGQIWELLDAPVAMLPEQGQPVADIPSSE